MSAVPAEIERYLHDHIPLSRDMGVSVVSADETGVRLAAPLLPNINHRNTAFGGSVSALAILAGWTLVHVRLQSFPLLHRIVIQHNAMEYLKPATGTFSAFCPAPSDEMWDRFVQSLTRWSKARITLKATLESENIIVGRFEGVYVALQQDNPLA